MFFYSCSQWPSCFSNLATFTATEMTSILIDEGECSVSHDVVSLFTNTPITEALEIIRNQLENDKRLKDRTNFETDDIMILSEAFSRILKTYSICTAKVYCVVYMFLNFFSFYQVVRPLGRKSVNKYLYLYLHKTTYYVEKFAGAPKDRISDEEKP